MGGTLKSAKGNHIFFGTPHILENPLPYFIKSVRKEVINESIGCYKSSIKLDKNYILEHADKGVFTIETDDVIEVNDDIDLPDITFSILCKEFYNSALIKGKAFTITVFGHNFINCGWLKSIDGDIFLRSSDGYVNSGLIDSSGDLKIHGSPRCQAFIFGTLYSRNILSFAVPELYIIGAKLTGEYDIVAKSGERHILPLNGIESKLFIDELR